MEEIKIDGINVTGCEFYDNGSCRECDMRVPFYSDIDCYDECNKNCYYKQLKRLEQENAELKETIQELNKAIQECNIQRTRLYKCLEEIREMTKAVRYFPQERLELIRNKINEVLRNDRNYVLAFFI